MLRHFPGSLVPCIFIGPDKGKSCQLECKQHSIVALYTAIFDLHVLRHTGCDASGCFTKVSPWLPPNWQLEALGQEPSVDVIVHAE